MRQEIELYIMEKGGRLCSDVCEEFSLRGKDVLYYLKESPVEIIRVRWINGFPLQIVTEEDVIIRYVQMSKGARKGDDPGGISKPPNRTDNIY